MGEGDITLIEHTKSLPESGVKLSGRRDISILLCNPSLRLPHFKLESLKSDRWALTVAVLAQRLIDIVRLKFKVTGETDTVGFV
jgi:hypothetical protein